MFWDFMERFFSCVYCFLFSENTTGMWLSTTTACGFRPATEALRHRTLDEESHPRRSRVAALSSSFLLGRLGGGGVCAEIF